MSNIVENWENLKELIESLEADLNKTAGGNKAAGVRLRKGLRTIKNQAAALVKESLQQD
jgi:DNA integrity scanning protein DisA with diadenylate cyclase activity